jgi:hypothetical protein
MPMKVLRTSVLVALLSLVVVSSGYGALTSNTQVTSSFTFFDQCSGEDVAGSGSVHLVTTSTITDNTLSGTFHSDFKATGIGQVSGLAYQEEVVANTSFQTSLINGEATRTFVGRINIVAPGAENNQSSPIFMHTTMDANGNVTSLQVEVPTITCR